MMTSRGYVEFITRVAFALPLPVIVALWGLPWYRVAAVFVATFACIAGCQVFLAETVHKGGGTTDDGGSQPDRADSRPDGTTA